MEIAIIFQSLSIVILALCAINVHGITNGEVVFDEVKKFTDSGLRVADFQNYMKGLTYSTEAINADTARTLTQSIDNKIRGYETELGNLKDVIERQYVETVTATQDDNCDSILNDTYDPLYGRDVKFDRWCIKGNVLLTNNGGSIRYLQSSNVLNSWTTAFHNANYKDGIKYIKYGDENGVLYQYPAKRLEGSYDNRYSTWYAETALPLPKDIIIMIDRSQSTKQSLPIAKEIANKVMDTLNSNDMIAVLSFGVAVEQPGDSNGKRCYMTELAKATDVNKENLKTFIDKITSSTDIHSNYTKALQTGFRIFAQSTGQSVRERVFIFLTDGNTNVQDTASVVPYFVAENNKMAKKVACLAFSVGSGIKNEVLLENLSNQDGKHGSSTLRGSYTVVSDANNIGAALASYYSFFQQGSSGTVKYSAPYKDVFASGLLISMCQSVKYQAKFKGVFCLDMDIEYLLSDVTYFVDNDGAYAFIVDSESRVLSHPMLPNIGQLAQESFFVFLPDVEIADHIGDITNGIKSKTSGSRRTNKVQIVPRGTGGGQDVLPRNQTVTYYWHPMDKTGFTVCIVAIASQREAVEFQAVLPIWFHTDYRRKARGEGLCQSFKRVAAKDRISVTLTTGSFSDPYKYIYFREPAETRIISFLNSEAAGNPNIKNGIRETVNAIVPTLEDFWKKAGYSDYIIWRYIGTSNGVMLVFPGLELPRSYDARIRPWFSGALVEKSNYFVTLPYIDLWGAGLIISLVSTITKSDSFTIGVMAMDLTLGSFYYTATRKIPECKQYMCIIINNAGFITVHKKWIESPTADEDVLDMHLVKEEPFIADTLIKQQVMRPTRCTDTAKSFKEREYWNVELANDRQFGIYFKITAIKGTNLFLITKMKDPGTIPQECDVDCGSDCPAGKSCHCPCVTDTNSYEYCTASLNTTMSLPCAPKLPSSDSSGLIENERQRMEQLSLPPCRDYQCSAKTTNEQCAGVLSCSWCSTSYEGKPCEYCSTDSTCSAERCKPISSNSDQVPDTSDTWLEKWEFAVIFIFVVVITAIFAVFLTCFIVARKYKEEENHYDNPRMSRFVDQVLPDENPDYFRGSATKPNMYHANDNQPANRPAIPDVNVHPPAPHHPPPPSTNRPAQNEALKLDPLQGATMNTNSYPSLAVTNNNRNSDRLSQQYAKLDEPTDRVSYITPNQVGSHPKPPGLDNPGYSSETQVRYDPFASCPEDSGARPKQQKEATVQIATPTRFDEEEMDD